MEKQTNINNQTMEKTMTKDQKATPVNSVNKSNTPHLSPEQQEWLNSVFVPNLRTQILKSARKDSALTASERQELAAYRDKFEQVEQQELEQKGHHGCQRHYGTSRMPTSGRGLCRATSRITKTPILWQQALPALPHIMNARAHITRKHLIWIAKDRFFKHRITI